MKRTLALFLMMTAAAFAQTPTVMEKAAAKAAAATVKVAPAATGQATKPSPNAVKVSVAQKPAAISVQPVIAKPSTLSAAKPVAVVATPAKAAVSVPKASPFVAPAASGKVSGNAPKVAVVPVKIAAVPLKTSAAKTVAVTPTQVKVPVKGHASKVHGKQTAGAKDSGSKTGTTVAVQDGKPAGEAKKPAPKAINAVGRRDPFVSPVVNLGAIGSGCSSGKRCLAIDQIALKGVVRSDVGMIAVVVNAMDKAYFLRENDPVFNGYVVKITVHSIVFKETFHDKLGKPLTRDVTKTISRPVA